MPPKELVARHSWVVLCRVLRKGLPTLVPARVPDLLYGTAWKKDLTAQLVERALGLGFRGLDTACQPKHYDEAGVGRGLAAALRRGVTRDQIYLQTKFTPLRGQDPRRVPYDPGASLEQQIRQSCARSLENLGTPYLDCLILHSPLERFGDTLRAWRELEHLVDEGVVRDLGISNCYALETLEALSGKARIPPLVVQNRFYADTGYDQGIRALCRARSMIYESFWTLSANPKLLAQRSVLAPAARHAVTPAQVLFRALTQIGIHPLTGTTSEAHMREDLAIFGFELSADELASLVAELR